MSEPEAAVEPSSATATTTTASYVLPPMPLLPISSPSTIHRCKNLRTDARDVFICSYPKSGTTWTQAIVRALVTLRSTPEHNDSDDWHITEYCPFFEADRTWGPDTEQEAEQQPFASLYAKRQQETGRRAYNTHLRWDMMPTGGAKARYLYVVRDGRDVAVSYFHHMRSMAVEDGGFEGSWDDFFEQWCQGEVPFGAWLDHLLSWCGGPAATDPRVLFLRYEAMKADLRTALTTIAQHIRIDPLPCEAELNSLVAQCSLEGMRAVRARYEPRSVAWRDPAFRFIRNGQVGDHAALFTPRQHACFARSLFERYEMICGDVGNGVVGMGVLPVYVTGALVGGEAGLLRVAGEEGEGVGEREGAGVCTWKRLSQT